MDSLALELARGLSTAIAVRAGTAACPACTCHCSPTLACAEGALAQEIEPRSTSWLRGGFALFGLGVFAGAAAVLLVQRWWSGVTVPALTGNASSLEKVAFEQLNLIRQRRGNGQ